MKKQKKLFVQIIVFLIILATGSNVFATDILNNLEEMKFSDSFLKYLELSEEERKKVIVPRMYDIPKTQTVVKNPLKLARMLRSTAESKYSLREVIPENMIVKNQQQTNSCWTFSTLASLETTLAYKDYKNGINPIVYDFSERHMEYATSQSFLDGATNEIGFNRKVGEGGNAALAIPYLTNGTGAISEEKMKFENNEDPIYISEIQNKNVVTQVNDMIIFPSYQATDDITLIKKQMKEHIRNYGGIDATVHGAMIDPNSKVYNNETGAIYCNDSIQYAPNHAVVIIGWDDNYSVENFKEGNRPENNGAWIIKNSWGSEIKVTLTEIKEMLFVQDPDLCIQYGWKDATMIPDDIAKEVLINNGYTINENNEGVLKIGDDGFMYVSYEDANIYLQSTGIVDAQTEIEYENIYQYDQYGGTVPFEVPVSKIYLATEFKKKTEGKEYLTQVSINAPETYTCKVYVNPNGTSKSMSDLQEAKLKAGETETVDAGYHTIEFAEPIKINNDDFVVVLEVQGVRDGAVSMLMEFNVNEIFNKGDVFPFYLWDNVTLANGKCFWSTQSGINANEWVDASTMYTLTEGNWPNFDTTIKAFTTSKVLENIQITTPPTKTSYLVGQDFDATGMIVKANYANGKSEVVTDYTIVNGKNLAKGQESVTISYKGKTVTQSIKVVENVVETLSIKTAPTKTEYWAGEDFDATGMVVEATYTDGTTKTITKYTINDGDVLKNGQTTVTIEFEGKTTTQSITVKANPVTKLEIEKAPAKVKYVEGQDFDTAGMIVKATYENGLERELKNYTIKDGNDLKEGQKTVTIEFEGQTVTQEITVEKKVITSIKVKTMPSKTEYLQNKEELNLNGGKIEILYNDETKEEMLMTSNQIVASGFDNKVLGKQTITLTYQEKTAQFEVEIIEEPKPENSNFDNMQGNVKRVRAYQFTDTKKKGYTIINVELDNIIKAENNDNMEYYYYLSSSKNENDIVNWVKISEFQNLGNKLAFEINTSDISNHEQIENADTLYLYVKEVAMRNGMKAEKVTSAQQLDAENISIEEYVDGEKKGDVKPGTITGSTPGDKNDNTTATGTIPKAGKSIMTIILIIAIFVISRIVYLRYKDIQIK